MKYSLTTKNIELTGADHELLDDKLNRLTKHLLPPFHARIVFRGDTHHRNGEVIQCTMTVREAGGTMHAERSSSSVQEALDGTLAALKRELIRHRDKRQQRR